MRINRTVFFRTAVYKSLQFQQLCQHFKRHNSAQRLYFERERWINSLFWFTSWHRYQEFHREVLFSFFFYAWSFLRDNGRQRCYIYNQNSRSLRVRHSRMKWSTYKANTYLLNSNWIIVVAKACYSCVKQRTSVWGTPKWNSANTDLHTRCFRYSAMVSFK